jgi:vacuolar-type H+-ATPase subunit E/Vma4
MSDVLISLLEEEAAIEQGRILQEAQSYAERAVQAAQEEADNAFAKERSHWQHWSEIEQEKLRKKLDLKIQSGLLKERATWLEKVRLSASEKLVSFRSDPRYPGVLVRLLTELQDDQQNLTITLHPQDQHLLPGLKAEELIFDEHLAPGIVGTTSDGKIEIRNTLPDRLEKAWPMLLGATAARLWKE